MFASSLVISLFGSHKIKFVFNVLHQGQSMLFLFMVVKLHAVVCHIMLWCWRWIQTFQKTHCFHTHGCTEWHNPEHCEELTSCIYKSIYNKQFWMYLVNMSHTKSTEDNMAQHPVMARLLSKATRVALGLTQPTGGLFHLSKAVQAWKLPTHPI